MLILVVLLHLVETIEEKKSFVFIKKNLKNQLTLIVKI